MNILDKVTQKATNLGKSTIKSVAKIGASATTVAQEQTELVQIKSQINVIERELDAFYVQIGRRYVDYVLETGDMAGIEAEDLIKLMEPNMAKKQELEIRVAELEKEIKRKTILRERQQAENEFLAEKAKLDKAFLMEIITQDEYDVKLAIAQKRVDNFEEIRRIRQQAEMNLITKEERDAKIKELTE